MARNSYPDQSVLQAVKAMVAAGGGGGGGGGFLPGYALAYVASGNVDNLNPDPGVWPTGIGRIDITPSMGVAALLGLVAGTDGQLVYLYNADPNNELDLETGASSTPGNSFQGVGGSVLGLPPQTGTWICYYAGMINAWRIL